MREARARRQIRVLVSLLMVLGVGVVLYKHYVLDFPLLTTETQDVWQIEARISFDSLGGPVEARLNMPDPVDSVKPIFSESLAPDYQFRVEQEGDREVAVWRAEAVPEGPSQVVLFTELFFSEKPQYQLGKPAEPDPLPPLSDDERAALAAVNDYINERQLVGEDLVRDILREINNPSSAIWELLQRERGKYSERLQLAIEIMNFHGIAVRLVRGVELKDRQRNRPARNLMMAYLDQQWRLFDPRAAEPVPTDTFLPFQRGDEALFEVSGAEDSDLEFSVIKVRRASYLNAVEDARNNRSWLVDFSIYSLPLGQQSTFKLLLLIPLGALVVVILRNLVGIRTSGTFMPILIALVFLQTSLLAGLILFLVVVSVGLFMRSYLSHLNLLLVPRIASVLVFVIIIFAAIGIGSHKLGIEWGMKVTFFPMIILSWTIERMSILWDEEGGREVMIQGGGSLLTASLSYLIMSNDLVADSIFLYPEALLILLAIIISIGSYSGYRLSDLRRFEPMERH